MIATGDDLSEYLWHQKPNDHEGGGERSTWKNKPLHIMYHSQIEGVADIEEKYQWLNRFNRGTNRGSTRLKDPKGSQVHTVKRCQHYKNSNTYQSSVRCR